MKPDKASFQVKDADASVWDFGSFALSCEIDFDRARKEWRAWDEHGNEAFADYKPLAAARLFTARLEADSR